MTGLLCFLWTHTQKRVLAESATSLVSPPLVSPQSFRFPALSVSYMQYRVKTYRKTKRKRRKRKPRLRLRRGVFHLSKVIGTKPCVMLYFAPGNPSSEAELQALQAVSKTMGSSLHYFGIVRVRNRRMLRYTKRRLKKLRITLPILLDWRGVLAYATLTRKLPSYAVLDKPGHLRLSQASALTELVAPHHSLLTVIQELAKGQKIPSIRAPGYTPNPYRWLGKKAPSLKTRVHFSSKPSKLVTTRPYTKRPTFVIFWSITCPHCRKILPLVQKYYREHKNQWSVISVVQLPKRSLRRTLKRFKHKHKLTFPLLSDPKGLLQHRFHVRSYPTFLLLDTTSKIRAVHFGATLPPQQLFPKLLRGLQ